MKAKSHRLLATYHPGQSRSKTIGTKADNVFRYTVDFEKLSKSLQKSKESQHGMFGPADRHVLQSMLKLYTYTGITSCHKGCAYLRVAKIPATAQNIDQVASRILDATSWPTVQAQHLWYILRVPIFRSMQATQV